MSSIHQFRKTTSSSCAQCGASFEGLKTKKFCSVSCKSKYHRELKNGKPIKSDS